MFFYAMYTSNLRQKSAGPRQVFPEMGWEVARDLWPYLHGLNLPVAVVVAVKRCPLFDVPVEQRCRRILTSRSRFINNMNHQYQPAGTAQFNNSRYPGVRCLRVHTSERYHRRTFTAL